MLVDAGPLIYLAKLDALDVFREARVQPFVTTEVERETSRPALAYDHPDSLAIAEALNTGVLHRTELTAEERTDAVRIQEQAPALKTGEAEVLAAGRGRNLPVLLFERRALRFAYAMALDVWLPPRLLFAGTRERARLRDRILEFARLVDLPYAQVEAHLYEVEEMFR
jgi:hypothetical protein